MQGSLARVRRVMSGEKPDRAPLFDLLPNDAVLAYFNGGRPVAIGDDRTAARAVAAAVDGSRESQLSPAEERDERLPDGRLHRVRRWTAWRERVKFASSQEYCEAKRAALEGWEEEVGRPIDTGTEAWYRQQVERRSWFGDDFYFLMSSPSPGLMGIWEEVGLEAFSYYLYDCEEVIVEQLERNTAFACRWIEGLPQDDPFEAAFIGEDIAFKTGPMMRVAWLEREYFPRLARVIAALHARGKKAMFHSDGNLNAIMDGLVAAGIDALNPVEVSAGMDLADLHRRYPQLVFAGGIDVTNLLPFGTAHQVRDAVVRAIEETEGKILVGSSTEVFDAVPLENFLAMREAAMGYSF
jgi:hypothetical protein